MEYLIDGYNLLHVTDIFVDNVGAGPLTRLHAALLDYLAACLAPEQCQRTTVVFDAKGRRATTRRMVQYAGMTVHYAARTEDADTLIAELVRNHHSPRQLTVVSSDHQVQRSAKRRRAKTVDSDVWYSDLRRGRLAGKPAPPIGNASKPDSLTEQDALWWLRQFDEGLLRELETDTATGLGPQTEASAVPPVSTDAATNPPTDQPGIVAPPFDAEAKPLELANPFPSEYIAEVVREVERESARQHSSVRKAASKPRPKRRKK